MSVLIDNPIPRDQGPLIPVLVGILIPELIGTLTLVLLRTPVTIFRSQEVEVWSEEQSGKCWETREWVEGALCPSDFLWQGTAQRHVRSPMSRKRSPHMV